MLFYKPGRKIEGVSVSISRVPLNLRLSSAAVFISGVQDDAAVGFFFFCFISTNLPCFSRAFVSRAHFTEFFFL